MQVIDIEAGATPARVGSQPDTPLPRVDKAKSIDWYRSPVDARELKRLYERSDAKGLAQTLGYLGVLVIIASMAWYSWLHEPWWLTALLVFLYGTCFAFQINAVHELGHGTVFKTKWLNVLFVHVFAFLGWINHRMFDSSHVRHHRSTLHPPDDLEVVLPMNATLKDFLKFGFVNPAGPRHVLLFMTRIARGRFEGEWELKLYPEQQVEKRRAAVSWARIVLAGHGLIVAAAIVFHLWMVPVLITLAPFYGGWLHFLCNQTQHIGLQDNVSDFRLCCRTFIPNPLVRFIYWHMNYHTEHHMYVGVPCYNLNRLRKLIEHDLPPAPRGIAATWREIGAILEKQAADPAYRHQAELPLSL